MQESHSGKIEKSAQSYFSLYEQYRDGHGVAKDEMRAILYLTKAAQEGHAIAQYELGTRYDFGKGVEKNAQHAVTWYKKAATQGHAWAQQNLGVCYFRGEGTEQNYKRAAHWVKKAAAQGLAAAQHAFGLMIQNGQGMDKNIEQAIGWYQKAAAQGDEKSIRALSNLNVKPPVQLPKKPEPVETEQDEMNAQACFKLYEQYRDGNGIQKDNQKAFFYLTKAADQGHAHAQYALAVAYSFGRGVVKDPDRAVPWYQKASAQGHQGAQYNLGVAYYEEIGVSKNLELAHQLFLKAAAQGNMKAKFYLGKMYHHGEGIPKDIDKAIQWHQAAAEQGYDPSRTQLAALATEKLKSLQEIIQSKKQTSSEASVDEAKVGPSKLPRLRASTLEASLQIQTDELSFDQEIGRGGFGVVHRGSWQHVDVAIKRLLHMSLSGKALAEFKSEVHVMAKLRHPHIVQLCGACMEPGQYAMVMEYVPNGSLYDVLRRPGNLSWQVRYQYGIDIGAGLSYLHSRNILHRDLKSMNVLVTSSNRAKLTDFGLAVLKQETKSSTQQGKGAAGTLLWMAPELFKRGGKMRAACDVYSYGVTLWEVATGKVPFSDAQNPHIAVGWVREGEREPIPEETPAGFSEVIRRCWSQEPESRPSASEATGLLKSSRGEVGLQGTPQVDRKGKGEASGPPRPTESVGSGSYGNLISGAGLSSGSQGSLGSVEMNSERNNLASSAAGVAQQSRGRTRSGAYGNLASGGFSPVLKWVSKGAKGAKGAKGMKKRSVGRGRGRGRPLPVRKSPLKKRLMGPKGAIKKSVRKVSPL